MRYLPIEIWAMIIKYLNMKSVISMASTCLRYNDLIELEYMKQLNVMRNGGAMELSSIKPWTETTGMAYITCNSEADVVAIGLSNLKFANIFVNSIDLNIKNAYGGRVGQIIHESMDFRKIGIVIENLGTLDINFNTYVYSEKKNGGRILSQYLKVGDEIIHVKRNKFKNPKSIPHYKPTDLIVIRESDGRHTIRTLRYCALNCIESLMYKAGLKCISNQLLDECIALYNTFSNKVGTRLGCTSYKGYLTLNTIPFSRINFDNQEHRILNNIIRFADSIGEERATYSIGEECGTYISLKIRKYMHVYFGTVPNYIDKNLLADETIMDMIRSNFRNKRVLDNRIMSRRKLRRSKGTGSNKYTAKELRDIAISFGLSTCGTKTVMVNMLCKHVGITPES